MSGKVLEEETTSKKKDDNSLALWDKLIKIDKYFYRCGGNEDLTSSDIRSMEEGHEHTAFFISI